MKSENLDSTQMSEIGECARFRLQTPPTDPQFEEPNQIVIVVVNV